jgi:hypothetical protein
MSTTQKFDNKVRRTQDVSGSPGGKDMARPPDKTPPKIPPSQKQQGQISPFEPNTDRSI